MENTTTIEDAKTHSLITEPTEEAKAEQAEVVEAEAEEVELEETAVKRRSQLKNLRAMTIMLT